MVIASEVGAKKKRNPGMKKHETKAEINLCWIVMKTARSRDPKPTLLEMTSGSHGEKKTKAGKALGGVVDLCHEAKWTAGTVSTTTKFYKIFSRTPGSSKKEKNRRRGIT